MTTLLKCETRSTHFGQGCCCGFGWVGRVQYRSPHHQVRCSRGNGFLGSQDSSLVSDRRARWANARGDDGEVAAELASQFPRFTRRGNEASTTGGERELRQSNYLFLSRSSYPNF